MFHSFHFLQCDMVLGIVNPLSWILHAISEKLPDFNAFPVNLHWRQDTKFFPLLNSDFPRASRMQGKWPETGQPTVPYVNKHPQIISLASFHISPTPKTSAITQNNIWLISYTERSHFCNWAKWNLYGANYIVERALKQTCKPWGEVTVNPLFHPDI